MRIKNLFYALLALPLVFVACEKDKVDEVKDPTVAVVAGVATENTVTFEVTSTEAEKVAWIVVEATEAVPTATEVFNGGTTINANESVEVTATDLKANTEYLVVAAAMNKKAAVKAEKTMTTSKGSGEPGVDDPENPGVDDPENPDDKEYDVEFVATQIRTDYIIEDGANFYAVELGDKGWQENGWGVDGGTYYGFIIAPSAKGNGVLPNGTYSLSEVVTPNTIVYELSYHYKMVDGKLEQGMVMYKNANLVISDGKVVATVEFEDGSTHRAVFEGDLSVDDGGSQPTDEFKATHVATEWVWGDATSYGNKYDVKGEGFELDVHFPAEFATAEGLAAGEYIWVNTSWWGTSEVDFDNMFTTREFLIRDVDGVMIYSEIIDSGKALVEKEGEEYHIQITLNGRGGTVYMIEYTGAITKPTVGGGEGDETITFTSMSEGTEFIANVYKYALKDDSGENKVTLTLDSSVAKASEIAAGTYSWVDSPSYIYNGDGNADFSFVNTTLYIAGTQYANSQVGAGTCTVAVEGGVYTITINVTVLGVEKTLKYVGAIGQQGSGNEGGEGTQLTKLATPSVKGLADGNAATVSWQVVEGAKDYTVTLNGTDVQTVEEAYVVYNNLAYSTTYNVSVVANPADATVNSASDAGTASFTTDADPNAGGDEGGNDDGGNSEWNGRAVKMNFLAYMDNVLYLNANNEAIYFMTSFRNGITEGTFVLNGSDKSEAILYSGYTNSQAGLFGGTSEFGEGETVEISKSGDSYTVVYRVTVDGEKLTATYTGGLN
ncbi:MAG: hypothetical protein IJX40_04385 [Alistipes sp.]|nr:hypothetical protein [Alistipes sp.]